MSAPVSEKNLAMWRRPSRNRILFLRTPTNPNRSITVRWSPRRLSPGGSLGKGHALVFHPNSVLPSEESRQHARHPESKVRIIKPKVGGGFGQKIDLYAKDFCAAFFAMKTMRPVKFVYEREEVFISTRQRHPMRIHLKRA